MTVAEELSTLKDIITKLESKYCENCQERDCDYCKTEVEDIPPAHPERHYCRECKQTWCRSMTVDKYGRSETFWWCFYWERETDEEGYCHEWERRTE